MGNSKMKDCYVCGASIPILEMENGYNFKCGNCESETQPQDTFEEAKKRWNEGRLFTGIKFWEMVFRKGAGK